MQLTKEQIEFLDRVCDGRDKWKLNSEGKVDVDVGSVRMDGMNLTEIPVKFGSVSGSFICNNNQLTSLKNAPMDVGGVFYCDNNELTSLEFLPMSFGGGFLHVHNNPLTNYFKNIKEEDFPHWDKLSWYDVLIKYPFLINIGKKYVKDFRLYLKNFPKLKIYLE